MNSVKFFINTDDFFLFFYKNIDLIIYVKYEIYNLVYLYYSFLK